MPTPTSPEQPAKTIPPAEAIAALGRGKLSPNDRPALSDLSRADARLLRSVWPGVDAEVRLDLVRALAELAESDIQYTFGRVFRVALGDDWAVIRQLAIAGLWEDDGSDLIDEYLAMMESDDSPDVRAEAALALMKFADLGAAGDLDEASSERVRTALLDAAESFEQTMIVRRRALESVAVYGGERIRGLIEEAYDSDDTAVRASAVYAMGRSLDRSWMGTILDEFESTDAELRYEAARASGELASVDALEGLTDLATDLDTEVRHAAIDALGKIGGPGSVRVLRAIAASCPPGDRDAVEDAIASALILSDAARARP